jgi:DNA repair exonuclease SbcCD nuclease subunit
MKVALLTDTHFGARSDNLQFDRHFREFFDDVFFPELKKNKITEVIHLGDVFDRRRSINFQTLHNCIDYFFNKLDENGIHMTVIVGNHDTFYKNTNDVNSVELILRMYENIDVLTSPAVKTFDDRKILLVPWICEATAQASAELLEKTKAVACFGHFEIAGFAMYRGMVNTEGLEQSIFDRFKLTCSGHFHHRSSTDNIFYLGSPYQMTWSDYGDSRGFHILDTKTLRMEFIENPSQMFHRIEWKDGTAAKPTAFEGKCVKLVVLEKSPKSVKKFDDFVDQIMKNGVADLKIVEDFNVLESDILDDENIVVENTITLLNEYVDSLDTEANKTRLKTVLQGLYIEAQHVEQA